MSELRVGMPGYGIPKEELNKNKPPKPKYLPKGPDFSRFLHPDKVPIKPKEGKPKEFADTPSLPSKSSDEPPQKGPPLTKKKWA